MSVETVTHFKSGYDQGCYDTVVEILHGKKLSGDGLHHYALLIRQTLEKNQVDSEVQKEVENHLFAMLHHVEGIRHK